MTRYMCGWMVYVYILKNIVNPLTLSVPSVSHMHALKRVVRGVRKISGDNAMSGIYIC